MIGFQSPSKQPINAPDETLRVSVAALTVAHENARLPSGSGDGASGSVAADIH